MSQKRAPVKRAGTQFAKKRSSAGSLNLAQLLNAGSQTQAATPPNTKTSTVATVKSGRASAAASPSQPALRVKRLRRAPTPVAATPAAPKRTPSELAWDKKWKESCKQLLDSNGTTNAGPKDLYNGWADFDRVQREREEALKPKPPPRPPSPIVDIDSGDDDLFSGYHQPPRPRWLGIRKWKGAKDVASDDE